MSFIEFLLLIASLVLLAPGVLLVLEFFTSLPALRRNELAVTQPPPGGVRTVVLIPAHNEAEILAPSLKALRERITTSTRILLVADNCSDDTATIARRSGVEVIERHDTDRRGKGFALDYGLRHLSSAPPDVVVVLDADCTITEGAIEHMSALAIATDRPVQALNQMLPSEQGNAKQQISSFAFTVKNIARGIGLFRLAGFVSLTGTGMAFPWSTIANVTLASSHVAEDLKLGADLARRGVFPMLSMTAKVTSQFPVQSDALETQKKRWQHGHLRVIKNEGLPLLFRGVRQANSKLTIYGLDLTVPPLVLYLVTIFIATLCAIGVSALNLANWPAYLFMGFSVLLILGIFTVWWRFGRGILQPQTLASIPGYIVSNLLLSVAKRQTSWIRTDRK